MAWFGAELPISILVNSVPNDLYSLLSVSPTISVGRDMLQSVKNAIFKVERIPPDEQRLIHAGKQLEELRTLSDCGIGPGTMLHLVFRIRGGGCVERLADDDEGARCVSAPAQQPTGVLAVGRIVSGAVVPHELTSKHWLAVNVNGGAPKLQFDVFVEEK